MAQNRLLREAQSLGRLDHPNVCRLFDLVKIGRQQVLVMEFVEGETLEGPARGQPLLEATRLIVIAELLAKGLAAAHRAGVVHRDLKPSNVMLTYGGEGEQSIKIVDFGIARMDGEPASTRHTTTTSGSRFDTQRGSTLGTLAYMSPEQIRGEIVGQPSDVYSLGIVLRELFTGSPSYREAGYLELCSLVADGSVEPFDQLPRPLTALLRSMLAPQPESRPSAIEVEAELRRIRLEPSRRRRRRILWAGGILTTAVVALMIGWTGVQRHKSQIRQELARDFGTTTARAESEWTLARLQPAHPVSLGDRKIMAMRGQIEARMEDLGSIAAGQGYLALGELDLVLGNTEAAVENLERARDLGEHPATLGRALAELYLDETERAARIREPAERQARIQGLRADLGQRALRELGGQSPSHGSDRSLVQALVALIEGRLHEAETLAVRASEQRPSNFQALLLAGRARQEQGRIHEDDLSTAKTHFAQALNYYERGRDIARSSEDAHLGVCNTRLALAINAHKQVSEAAEAIQNDAFEACDAALEVAPGDIDLIGEIANGWYLIGRQLAGAGKDPTKAWRRSVALAEHAQRIDPEHEDPPRGIGTTHLVLGHWLMRQGEDPTDEFNAAEDALRRSTVLEPASKSTWNDLGILHLYRAEWALDHGEVPEDDLRRALGAYDEVLRQDPGNRDAFSNRGIVHWRRAEWAINHDGRSASTPGRSGVRLSPRRRAGRQVSTRVGEPGDHSRDESPLAIHRRVESTCRCRAGAGRLRKNRRALSRAVQVARIYGGCGAHSRRLAPIAERTACRPCTIGDGFGSTRPSDGSQPKRRRSSSNPRRCSAGGG